MTASAFVDQSAAFIVVSEARADELGIPQDKRVYLHGEAHAHDTWFVSDRERLDQSPAMRLTSRAALAQAGKTIADVDVFDIYSCFPSVVQIACKELGISPDDKRGLTVTGGLPYFGGPGNNYVTHAIAEMVQRVRAKPGAYGLVMANVGLVTKGVGRSVFHRAAEQALHARGFRRHPARDRRADQGALHRGTAG
jgi:acetyl-CoA C-acetyltransferase